MTATPPHPLHQDCQKVSQILSRIGEKWSMLVVMLLRDAVLRVVGAAGTIGVRALLVHAISDEAKAFYEHWGFRASATDPMTLMITIEEAQKMLGRPR